MILHAEQPTSNATSQEPEATLCRQLGLCVCQKPALLRFVNKLQKWMKQYFTKTGQTLSCQRAFYENGLIVLRIESRPSSGESLFLHCGYTNFRSWHFAVTRLRHIGTSGDVLHLSLGCPGQLDDLPETWVEDFRSIWEAVDLWVDVSKPCDIECFEILSDDTVLPPEDMCAGLVDVRKHGDFVWCWQGPGEEGERKTARRALLPGKKPERRPRQRSKGRGAPAQREAELEKNAGSEDTSAGNQDSGRDAGAGMLQDDLVVSDASDGCVPDAESSASSSEAAVPDVEDDAGEVDSDVGDEGLEALLVEEDADAAAVSVNPHADSESESDAEAAPDDAARAVPAAAAARAARGPEVGPRARREPEPSFVLAGPTA